MSGSERRLLYRLAIETGLRSNELRSLTRGSLFLNSDRPYIVGTADSTKNKKDARQYIQPDVASNLIALIAAKSPKARVFRFPHETNLARMLRADLAAARQAWLKEAKRDPEERLRREQSDFLNATNHEGEHFDFHSLRHTCGGWLAMQGNHPKVVQTIMRHSSITLTMDTYGLRLRQGHRSEWSTIAKELHDAGGALQYQTEAGSAQRLLYEFLNPELKNLPPRHKKFRANRSMRDVEPSVNLWLRTLDGVELPSEEEGT